MKTIEEIKEKSKTCIFCGSKEVTFGPENIGCHSCGKIRDLGTHKWN